MRKNGKKGFTLIELLVVVAIISLLTSIVLASLNDARKKGRDAARIRSMIEIRTALNLYFSDKGEYPKTGQLTTALTSGSKYISSINPDIKYMGADFLPPTSVNSCLTGSTCVSYHLGVKLELPNSVLNSDADLNDGGPSSAIDGVSANPNCGDDDANTTSNDPDDRCYDLVP